MLVLSRKRDEEILIGHDITVTVLSITNGRVKLGVEAPSDVIILRSELNVRPDPDQVSKVHLENITPV